MVQYHPGQDRALNCFKMRRFLQTHKEEQAFCQALIVQTCHQYIDYNIKKVDEMNEKVINSFLSANP